MPTRPSAARAPRWLAAGVAALLLSACQPSLEDVISEHRPAVETVFGQLKALAGPARDAAPAGEDRFDAGGARIVLDDDDAGSNALFIVADDLAAPELASADDTGATRAGSVETCGEALRGEFQGVPGGAALFLAECGRAEYAFVLRTTTDQRAELVDDDSFRPGEYAGDVLLFRLADGALLGGFRVSAKSSDQVQVRTNADGVATDAIERLNSDLSSQVFVGIDTKLRELLPGVLPPA